jgi:hypothetical protein
MADRVFTLHCTCEGDECSCHNPLDENIRFDFRHLSAAQCKALADDIESLPPAMQVALTKQLLAKGTKEMTTTTVLETIRAAKDLSVNDLKTLVQALSTEIRAKESAHSKHSARLERLAAANDAVSRNDGRAMNWILRAQRSLRELGLSDDIDANAKAGYPIADVDKAMKAAKWDQEKRITTKSMLDQLGLLAS